MSIEKLDAAIRAVCPIHGVSSERVISFRDEATPEQRAAAQAIADGWDFLPGIADLKAAQRANILADCEHAIAAIRAGYPESEVLSWAKQETEARALVADAGAATPLLDALALARGIDKAELAARVIAKADAFAAISGALIGKRQRLEDELDALPADATPEQVVAIVW